MTTPNGNVGDVDVMKTIYNSPTRSSKRKIFCLQCMEARLFLLFKTRLCRLRAALHLEARPIRCVKGLKSSLRID